MKTEQLEAYLNGELCAERAESFELAMRHDEKLREAFLCQLEMDTALSVLVSETAYANTKEECSSSDFTESVMARLRLEGADSTNRGFAKSVLTEILEEHESIRPLRWPDLITAGFVAAAASIALMFVLQGVLYRNGNSSTDISIVEQKSQSHLQPEFIARVQNGKEATWASETKEAMRKDGWLSNGLIKLQSGSAIIAFNSGATALIEGPAELSLETPNRAFLKYGKLTAEVPGPASGFSVATPRMNIVDIGTRFGVYVSENGDSDLHVMHGVVEASRSSGNSVAMLVEEGSSYRADSRTRSELVAIPYAGNAFTLRLSAEGGQKPEPALRYQFDESGGSILLDSGTSKLLEASLLPDSSGRQPPRRAPGHSGGGLVIQGGESFETVLPKKFETNSALTIRFWLKIPASLGSKENGIILSYGQEDHFWRVLCNQNALDGSGGALRVEFGENGYVVGSTDLADGQWHRVALRFLGGKNADIATHVHLFVDGKLENASGWQAEKIRADRAGVLTLGSSNESGFQGWIDDLEIYTKAISTTAIQGAD